MKVTVFIEGKQSTHIVDAAYFFNSDTHGDVEALIARSDLPQNTDKMLFVSAETVEQMIVQETDE